MRFEILECTLYAAGKHLNLEPHTTHDKKLSTTSAKELPRPELSEFCFKSVMQPKSCSGTQAKAKGARDACIGVRGKGRLANLCE